MLEKKEMNRQIDIFVKQSAEFEAKIRTAEFRNSELELRIRDGKFKVIDKIVQVEVIVPKIEVKLVEVKKYIEKPTQNEGLTKHERHLLKI